MRFLTAFVLAVGISLLVQAQEGDKKPEATKELAKSIWNKLTSDPVGIYESKKIILLVPKALEAKAKDIGTNLDKHYEIAAKSLGYKEDNSPWNGKLMVFVLPDREQFVAFVRRVEKRSPQNDSYGAFGYLENIPHLAVGTSKGKNAPNAETQAYIELGGALIRSKAGEKTPLPDWVTDGFGRAVYWRFLGNANNTVQNNKRKILTLSKKTWAVGDFWSGSDPENGPLLQTSLMEYLAFGPQAAKLPEFLKGFIPDENGESKSAEQAFDSSGLVTKNILGAWKV